MVPTRTLLGRSLASANDTTQINDVGRPVHSTAAYAAENPLQSLIRDSARGFEGLLQLSAGTLAQVLPPPAVTAEQIDVSGIAGAPLLGPSNREAVAVHPAVHSAADLPARGRLRRGCGRNCAFGGAVQRPPADGNGDGAAEAASAPASAQSRGRSRAPAQRSTSARARSRSARSRARPRVNVPGQQGGVPATNATPNRTSAWTTPATGLCLDYLVGPTQCRPRVGSCRLRHATNEELGVATRALLLQAVGNPRPRAVGHHLRKAFERATTGGKDIVLAPLAEDRPNTPSGHTVPILTPRGGRVEGVTDETIVLRIGLNVAEALTDVARAQAYTAILRMDEAWQQHLVNVGHLLGAYTGPFIDEEIKWVPEDQQRAEADRLLLCPEVGCDFSVLSSNISSLGKVRNHFRDAHEEPYLTYMCNQGLMSSSVAETNRRYSGHRARYCDERLTGRHDVFPAFDGMFEHAAVIGLAATLCSPALWETSEELGPYIRTRRAADLFRALRGSSYTGNLTHAWTIVTRIIPVLSLLSPQVTVGDHAMPLPPVPAATAAAADPSPQQCTASGLVAPVLSVHVVVANGHIMATGTAPCPQCGALTRLQLSFHRAILFLVGTVPPKEITRLMCCGASRVQVMAVIASRDNEKYHRMLWVNPALSDSDNLTKDSEIANFHRIHAVALYHKDSSPPPDEPVGSGKMRVQIDPDSSRHEHWEEEYMRAHRNGGLWFHQHEPRDFPVLYARSSAAAPAGSAGRLAVAPPPPLAQQSSEPQNLNNTPQGRPHPERRKRAPDSDDRLGETGNGSSEPPRRRRMMMPRSELSGFAARPAGFPDDDDVPPRE